MKPYHFGSSHSVVCWTIHDDCALRAAASYLTARIEHDRARLGLIRSAGAITVQLEMRKVALETAREILTASHETDWKRQESA